MANMQLKEKKARVLCKELLRVYDTKTDSWKDGSLKAKSDGTVKYWIVGAITKTAIDIGPFVSTTRPKFGNFDFVFVVNTEPEGRTRTGPRFAVRTDKSCKRWLAVLNLISLQKRLKLKHSHPLTKKVNGKAANAPCSICMKSARFTPVLETVYHQCEFCDYGECELCYEKMNDNLEEFVDSAQHPHPLIRLNSARGMWISSEYKGKYQCDICDATSTSTVYHCVECGDYDLCPKCTYKMPEGQLVGRMETDWTARTPKNLALNPRLLSSVIKVGTECKLGAVTSQKCPEKMSVITSKCFNLDQIESEAVPSAYMEVTFKEFKAGSTVGVGIGNQIFRQNEFLGHQQNSYGVFNNGTACMNSAPNMRASPQFKSGDTIGIGVMHDTFNQRTVFFTKNGKRVGTFEQTVHFGMDCFPGVSFSKDSNVTFTVNFTGPFKCDLLQVAGPRCDKDFMSNLPLEITEVICSLTVNSAARALQLRETCKIFAKAMQGNRVWCRVFALKWPNQNTNLKIKSWLQFYRTRSAAVKSTPNAQPIENCDFEFECPVLWSKLEANGSNKDGERFCDKCKKTVYSVSDVTTMNLYAEMGRCVSLEVEQEVPGMDGGRRNKKGKFAPPKAFVRTKPF